MSALGELKLGPGRWVPVAGPLEGGRGALCSPAPSRAPHAWLSSGSSRASRRLPRFRKHLCPPRVWSSFDFTRDQLILAAAGRDRTTAGGGVSPAVAAERPRARNRVPRSARRLAAGSSVLVRRGSVRGAVAGPRRLTPGGVFTSEWSLGVFPGVTGVSPLADRGVLLSAASGAGVGMRRRTNIRGGRGAPKTRAHARR